MLWVPLGSKLCTSVAYVSYVESDGHQMWLFWCFMMLHASPESPERPDSRSNFPIPSQWSNNPLPDPAKLRASAPTALYQGLWYVAVDLDPVGIHIESSISKHLLRRFCKRLVPYGNQKASLLFFYRFSANISMGFRFVSFIVPTWQVRASRF